MAVDPKFIVDYKGKDCILYGGLVQLATEQGLQSIVVEMIQYADDSNNRTARAKATAKTVDGRKFVEFGDANEQNTGKMIWTALDRMAATRAKARALRDLTNVGLAAFEEMPSEEEPRYVSPPPKKNSKPSLVINPEKPVTENEKQMSALVSATTALKTLNVPNMDLTFDNLNQEQAEALITKLRKNYTRIATLLKGGVVPSAEDLEIQE